MAITKTVSANVDNTTLQINIDSNLTFSPTQPVSMNTQRLTNVGDPVDDYDAAPRNYVDTSLVGGAKLGVAQTFTATNTFTQPIVGSITGNAATASSAVTANNALLAVNAQQATTADYAQNSGVATVARDFFAPVVLQLTGPVTGNATLSGSVSPVTIPTTFAGNLNTISAPTSDYSFASHKLTNLTNPTNAQDAATKNYVDTAVGGGSNGPVFYADLFSQTLTAGTESKLICNFIRFNKGNNYDPNTTQQFTSPLTGYYHFIGQIIVESSPGLTSLQLTIYKDGSAAILKNLISLGTNTTSTQGLQVVGIDQSFTAGRTYELRALASGANATVTFASFQGYWFAPL